MKKTIGPTMRHSYLLVPCLFLLAGCDFDDKANTKLCNNVEVGDYQGTFTNIGDNQGTDTAGDASSPFIDIVSATVFTSEEQIVVNIEVLQMPELDIFNTAISPNTQTEYWWEVMFDVDCNSYGDFGIIAYFYSYSPGVERVASINDAIKVGTISYHGEPPLLVGLTDADLEIQGNVFTITAQKNSREGLNLVTDYSPFSANAHFNTVDDTFTTLDASSDSLPDRVSPSKIGGAQQDWES